MVIRGLRSPFSCPESDWQHKSSLHIPVSMHCRLPLLNNVRYRNRSSRGFGFAKLVMVGGIKRLSDFPNVHVAGEHSAKCCT